MCLAIPGQVRNITERGPAARMAEVDFGGLVKTVNLVYVPEAKVGDFVIVHAGFATSRLDEAEAREALEYARQMSLLADRGSETASA